MTIGLSLLFLSSGLYAEKIFNASLVPDLALYPQTEVIEGLTVSFWGENEQSSLALGFVHGSRGDSAGLSWGLVNYAENYRGVQWAVVNYNGGDFSGWQAGLVNFVEGDAKGVQTGLVNYAKRLKGLQLGLVNYAINTEDAVQIGLLNIVDDNDKWFGDLPSEVAPSMILVNWSF